MLYGHHMYPSRSQCGFPSILASQGSPPSKPVRTRVTFEQRIHLSFHDQKSESGGSYACSQIIKRKEAVTPPRLHRPLQIVTQLFTGRRGDKAPEGLGHRHTDLLKGSHGRAGESRRHGEWWESPLFSSNSPWFSPCFYLFVD